MAKSLWRTKVHDLGINKQPWIVIRRVPFHLPARKRIRTAQLAGRSNTFFQEIQFINKRIIMLLRLIKVRLKDVLGFFLLNIFHSGGLRYSPLLLRLIKISRKNRFAYNRIVTLFEKATRCLSTTCTCASWNTVVGQFTCA